MASRGKASYQTTERHRSWSSVFWGLFFAVNDRSTTYQQRRNWRARATFFFLAGVIATVLVEVAVKRYAFGPCPK
jgi:hypothetical protein